MAQPYDVFMAAVLVLCALYGTWRGMAWQVAALAAIVLSAVAASRFGGSLAPYISTQTPWNQFVAMFIVYAATSLVIWTLFRMVSQFINRLQLKEFDRQLGTLLGAVKGVLWCVVITFFTVTLSEPARQQILASRSGYYIARLTERAGPILPPDVRAVVGKYLAELDRKLNPNTPPDLPPAESSPGTRRLQRPSQPGSPQSNTGSLLPGLPW